MVNLISVLVKDENLKPIYAEYLFNNKTKELNLAKPSYDCRKDKFALLKIAQKECAVFVLFSLVDFLFKKTNQMPIM